jgi:hypothetical protein
MMMIYEHSCQLGKERCLVLLTKFSLIAAFSENKQLHRLMHIVSLHFTLNVDALFFEFLGLFFSRECFFWCSN